MYNIYLYRLYHLFHSLCFIQYYILLVTKIQYYIWKIESKFEIIFTFYIRRNKLSFNKAVFNILIKSIYSFLK